MNSENIQQIAERVFKGSEMARRTPFSPLKGRRSDGENDLHRGVPLVVPDVKGFRGNPHAVPLAEGEDAGVDLQIHGFAGIEEGHLLAGMAPAGGVRAAVGRNDHHAEFNRSPGIRSQKLVEHIWLPLSSDGFSCVGSDDGGVLGVLLEKIVERCI